MEVGKFTINYNCSPIFIQSLTNLMKTLTLAIIFIFSFGAQLFSQQLNKQMKVDSLWESQKINTESDKSYLLVHSQIPNLRFESNRLIEKVNQLSSGDWEVWLPYGTHILKIDAEGFQRLELPATNFGKKRSYEMNIVAVGFAPTSDADKDLVEIKIGRAHV